MEPPAKATRQNRDTLKGYFSPGAQPTSEQFEQLIESSLNLLDDGFSCTRDNGVQMPVTGMYSRLLSFFRNNPPAPEPDWAITFGKQNNSLNFARNAGAPADASSMTPGKRDHEVLTLTSDSKVGVNNTSPDFALDVNGTVRVDGRFGTTGQVDADGKSYPITATLHGCHALEVVAGVGFKNTGRWAMVHAIAMNAYNPTGWLNLFGSPKKIRCTHSWYLSRADRIKLHWVKVKDDDDPHAYRLELKTLRDYGEGVQVRFSVTELWPYPDMGSEIAPAQSGPSRDGR